MVKGKNTPAFLKNPDRQFSLINKEAEMQLGHRVGRNECAVLRTGKGLFVDSKNRDPVTGLYKVHSIG
jgi:hypothetical protein